MGKEEELLLEAKAREGIIKIRKEVSEALELLAKRLEAVQSISGPLPAATHVMIGTSDSTSIIAGARGFDWVIVLIEKIIEQKGVSALNKEVLQCLVVSPSFLELSKVLQRLGLLQ